MLKPGDSSAEIPTDADLLGLPEHKLVVPGHGRDLIEQIASEYLDAIRAGRRPVIDDYVKEHPELEDAIRELFPLIDALEDWKEDQELSTAHNAIPENFEVEQLGECRVIREIGRGGMGVVFEAEEGAIARRVAVKVLPWKFSAGSRWREKFHQEARTAAQIRHPNIVSVYSFGEQAGICYYVMQLVEGIGLNRVILRLRKDPGIVTGQQILSDFQGTRGKTKSLSQERRLLRRDSWPQYVKIALKVAHAIRYAHQQGILHRDIKPANLLMDAQGEVWVADFGLALPVEEAVRQGPARIAGTLRYIAPEQFEGQVDERSDLYSFGLTLYELCTLVPAYDISEKKSLVQQIRNAPPPRPRKVNPAIPKGLEAIILKATHKDPDKRFQNASELITALRGMLSAPRWWDWWNPFRSRP